MKKYALVIVIATSFMLPIQSAWFGPDNYEECTYEKVKDCDGNKQCNSAAYKLCSKGFPFEIGEWKKITWDDLANSSGKIRVVDPDFHIKICFQNNDLNIKKECKYWEYTYGLSTHEYSLLDIANINTNKKFLDSKSVFLKGTSYSIYKAERKRIEK